jgi:hypothetical protein
MKKRRNWLLVLFGVVVLVVFVGIGAVIAIGAWVQQNMTVHGSSAADAQAEFETVRRRFSERPPLLELRHGRPAYAGSGPPAATATPQRLERMYVLAWDREDSRLVSLSIPFWVLRLKATPIQFSAYASGFDDNGVKLRPEDIERYGPGIILDTNTPSGERVLLWAQ